MCGCCQSIRQHPPALPKYQPKARRFTPATFSNMAVSRKFDKASIYFFMIVTEGNKSGLWNRPFPPRVCPLTNSVFNAFTPDPLGRR